MLQSYPELVETPTDDYYERTNWNVRDSDATLVLFPGDLESSIGTEYTIKIAQEYQKPCLVLEELDVEAALAWLGTLEDNLDLNVAGPRLSNYPGIDTMAFDLILIALPKKVQFVINIIIKAVSCAFACYYFWYSVQLVIQTWGRYTSGFKVPLWTLYGAQPVFCVCLFFVMLNLLFEDIREMRSERAKLQNTIGEGGDSRC